MKQTSTTKIHGLKLRTFWMAPLGGSAAWVDTRFELDFLCFNNYNTAFSTIKRRAVSLRFMLMEMKRSVSTFLSMTLSTFLSMTLSTFLSALRLMGLMMSPALRCRTRWTASVAIPSKSDRKSWKASWA